MRSFFIFLWARKIFFSQKQDNFIKIIKIIYRIVLIGGFVFYYSFLIDKTYQAGIEIVSQKFSSQTAFFLVLFSSWFGYEATRWLFKKKFASKNSFFPTKRLVFNMFLNTFVYGSRAILGVVFVVFLSLI